MCVKRHPSLRSHIYDGNLEEVPFKDIAFEVTVRLITDRSAVQATGGEGTVPCCLCRRWS